MENKTVLANDLHYMRTKKEYDEFVDKLQGEMARHVDEMTQKILNENPNYNFSEAQYFAFSVYISMLCAHNSIMVEELDTAKENIRILNGQLNALTDIVYEIVKGNAAELDKLDDFLDKFAK